MATQLKMRVAFAMFALGIVGMMAGMHSPELAGSEFEGSDALQLRQSAGIFADSCTQMKTNDGMVEKTLPVTCMAHYNEQYGLKSLLDYEPVDETDDANKHANLSMQRKMIAAICGFAAIALGIITLILFPSAFGKYGVTRCGTKMIPLFVLLTVAAGAVSLGMFSDPHMITLAPDTTKWTPGIMLIVTAGSLALMFISFFLVLMGICAERRRVRDLQREEELREYRDDQARRELQHKTSGAKDHHKSDDYHRRADYNNRSYDHHNAHMRYDR